MVKKSRYADMLPILEQTYKGTSAWKEVEEVLEKEGELASDEFYDPFKNLIIGILSQNTSDRNCTKAYLSLKRSFEISPFTLADADEEQIKEAIKCGGLYNVKAKRIKDLSKAVVEKFNGDLSTILRMENEEARKELLKLHGIGPKTADVFIAYCCGYSAFPVDTNIDRVVKRMGLASIDASYDEVQKSVMEIIPQDRLVRAHELLIRLGRDYCKAMNPSCPMCPVTSFCEKHV